MIWLGEGFRLTRQILPRTYDLGFFGVGGSLLKFSILIGFLRSFRMTFQ